MAQHSMCGPQQVIAAPTFLPTPSFASAQESIDASYKAANADEAYAVTDAMLKSLGKLAMQFGIYFPEDSLCHQQSALCHCQAAKSGLAKLSNPG